jgi:tetratricopeptide (TPR) repeat protein
MRRLAFTVIAIAALVLPTARAADQPGQADLDQAADLQVTAETLGDLEKVIKLAESALAKGLDKDQKDLANKLLAAALFQHANRSVESLFERRRVRGNIDTIRKQALKDLDKAKKYDPTLSDLYVLEAKLHALPPGSDNKAAAAAASEAIKVLTSKDEPKELSKAYMLRAQIVEDKDRKLADFEAALKADPSNGEAAQALAVLYRLKGDNDKALATLQKLVEQDPDNPNLLALFAESLTESKKYDEALKYCDDVIKQAPRAALGYKLRARVRVMKEDVDGAIKDLDEALSINREDPEALLMRSSLHASQGHDDKANSDLDRLQRIAPDVPQILLLRSRMAASKKKWGEAITQMQLLLQTDPTNAEYRIQLAGYLVGDGRPRKAIELLTQVLDSLTDDSDPQQKENKSDALRARGDALLSVGKHADAIKDYDEALKLDPEDTGVLNNLAWVLATSPEDGVRDADRSIKFGTKAAELTKYQRAHILSTLAAGYAEKGDFETAKKWSARAVEIGAKEDEVDSQLKKELESYQEKKPWREKQEIEENKKPLGKGKTDLET